MKDPSLSLKKKSLEKTSLTKSQSKYPYKYSYASKQC